MKINNILDCIGNTPLIKLEKIITSNTVEVYAKLEGHNLTGSMKARSALGMILEAEKRGEIKPGDTIIESTSGNLGYALAAIGTQKGYNITLVIDPKTDDLKKNILKGYGAKLEIVSDPDKNGAFQPARINRVKELLEKTPNSWTTNQYSNPDNMNAHYKTLGPEIYEDMEQNIDVLIAAVGTCGHLGGAAKYIKEKNPNLRVIGVEPFGSVLSGGTYHPYLIQGPGLSFIPPNLDKNIISEIIKISDTDAIYTARTLARTESILSGSSAGSVIYQAQQIIPELKKGTRVGLILADGGFRYGSNFYSDNWLIQHSIKPN